MENKNFFENWMETQQKLMNNWVSSTQKLQDAVKNGSVAEKGTGIYNEWLNNQVEITKSATDQAVKNTTTFTNPFATNGNTSFDFSNPNNWIENQQNLMKQWMEMSARFYAPFINDTNKTYFDQAQNTQNQWVENYSNWANQWAAPFTAMSKNFSNPLTKDAYQNMLNMSGTYFKLYELWAPVYKNMQAGNFTPEAYTEFFKANADKFKEVMDKSFSVFSPVQVKELYEQFNAWFEVLNNYNRHAFQQMQGAMPNNTTLFPFLMNGNDGNNSPFAFYQRAISPVVRLFNPGKESETNEQVNAILETLSKYGKKLAELQYLMYTTGTKTYEKLVFDNYDQIKKGVDLSNFQQVFQGWVNQNEKSFTELFSTDEYSKLQGELLDLGLDIRSRFEKLAEAALQPYPVVTRSEADELYKTIHDLKKRIHSLEKQLNIQEESTEEKTATKSKKKSATV